MAAVPRQFQCCENVTMKFTAFFLGRTKAQAGGSKLEGFGVFNLFMLEKHQRRHVLDSSPPE